MTRLILKNKGRIKGNYDFILFGETHGYVNDVAILAYLIRKTKPSLLFWELLETARLTTKTQQNRFLKRLDSDTFSFISTFGDLKKTIAIAKKYNLPIHGCDFKNLGRKAKIEFTSKQTIKEEKAEARLLLKRERY